MIPGTFYFLVEPHGRASFFYRVTTIKYNDGTVEPWLQYLSFCNLWQGSGERNTEQFIKDRLIQCSPDMVIKPYSEI